MPWTRRQGWPYCRSPSHLVGGVMDASHISQLYALANEGDFQTQRAWLTDDYRHHVLALGIDWEGADAALAGLQKTWQDFDLEWVSERVELYPPFAVSYSTVKSNLRADPFHAVNVYRLEGDLLAEGWVFLPPLG